MRPWKLLEVSFFLFSFVALVHAKDNCNPCSCKLSLYFLLSCKLSSCKLYLLVQNILANCIHLVNYILANYIHLVYCVIANYIHAPLFFFSAEPFDMVLLFKGWTWVLKILSQWGPTLMGCLPMIWVWISMPYIVFFTCFLCFPSNIVHFFFFRLTRTHRLAFLLLQIPTWRHLPLSSLGSPSLSRMRV